MSSGLAQLICAFTPGCTPGGSGINALLSSRCMTLELAVQQWRKACQDSAWCKSPEFSLPDDLNGYCKNGLPVATISIMSDMEEEAAQSPFMRFTRMAALLVTATCLIVPLILPTIMANMKEKALGNFLDRMKRKFLSEGTTSEQEEKGDNSLQTLQEGSGPSLADRFAYKIDIWFSISKASKPIALMMVVVWLVLVSWSALFAFGDDDPLWKSIEGVGIAWTFIGEGENLALRCVAVATSVGGLLVTSLFMGIVGDAISEKVDSLKKGKSKVVEANHTLIIGWSEKLLPIVNQLSIANESEGGGVVVVLSSREKEAMETDIQSYEFTSAVRTTIICRTGSSLNFNDLKKVSADQARSIIVLAGENPNMDEDERDGEVLQVLLSLRRLQRDVGLEGHIVTEVNELENEPLFRSIFSSQSVVYTVTAHNSIGRLMIQCSLSSRAGEIWLNLLGFEGNEFYLKHWEELVGTKYGTAIMRFENAVAMGIQRGEQLMLNPSNDEVIQEDDEIWVLAEDDDTYHVMPHPIRLNVKMLVPHFKEYAKPVRLILVGWRRDMTDMILAADQFLLTGSSLYLFCSKPIEDRMVEFDRVGFNPLKDLQNIRLEHKVGDGASRYDLQKLPLLDFDAVLVLAEDGMDESKVLVTTMLLYDVHTRLVRQMEQTTRKAQPVKAIIVSEIPDAQVHALLRQAQSEGANNKGMKLGCVLSNELHSKALAMVSENPQLSLILNELLSGADGNELYLRPATQYALDGEELNVWEMMARARVRRHTMLGYQLAGMEKALLNPLDKMKRIVWHSDDALVIIGEDSGVDEYIIGRGRPSLEDGFNISQKSPGQAGRKHAVHGQHSQFGNRL